MVGEQQWAGKQTVSGLSWWELNVRKPGEQGAPCAGASRHCASQTACPTWATVGLLCVFDLQNPCCPRVALWGPPVPDAAVCQGCALCMPERLSSQSVLPRISPYWSIASGVCKVEEIGGNSHSELSNRLGKPCKRLGLVLRDRLQWRKDSNPWFQTSLGMNLTYFECNITSQPRLSAMPN